MHRFFRLATTLIVSILVPGTGVAQDPPGAPGAILDEVFGAPAQLRPSAPGPHWRPGHGTVVWIDDRTAGVAALIEFDPATGDRRAILDAAIVAEAWSDIDGETPAITKPVWRPDGGAILITGGDRPTLYDFSTRAATVLSTGTGAVQHADFAPDGRRIAWVRGNDLWVYDLELGREIRLTDDGSGLIWLRLDDGEVPVYHLVDFMGTHSAIRQQRYPKAGDPSPQPSLHALVFNATSGVSRRKSLTFDDPVPYVPRFGFTPGGDLWYQSLDRAQERLQLVENDVDSSSGTLRIDEKDPFWIGPVDAVEFLADESFLWLSPRSGRTHLYRIGSDGTATDLTRSRQEVTELIGVDPESRFAWYQAVGPSALERRILRVDLRSSETIELTPAPGVHEGALDPTTGRLLIRSSSAGAPPRWRVVDGVGAGVVEVPVEHPIPRIDFADHRFVQIEAEDGLTLDAMLLLPPGFDEAQPHPVVVYTYGGPNAQVVIDSWPRTSGLFNQVLANLGFVVFALDNRGATGRGRAFETAADHALGSAQLPDQLAGVAWLKNQPWVSADRIGIWGWSYGGYMTALALTRAPGVFAAGAAVAPVTDWRLYDSVYTERYMGTPAENPSGYAAGSVLDAVGNLVDPLLVIHGTGDDNVHLQHSVQLADRAWRQGVRFDLMLFPNLGHGINESGSHRQVFGAIAAFFEEHLKGKAETER
jgi:dipeptidyl-peptidase-4